MDISEYGLNIIFIMLLAGLSAAESDLPILNNPPTLKNHTGNSITIFWQKWSAATDTGQGTPIAYRVEISDERGIWKTIREVDANDWSELNDGFEITIENVNTKSQYLRIVVVDQSGGVETNSVPAVHIPPANIEHKDGLNTTLHHGNETSYRDLKDDVEEWLIWIGIAAGGALITAILIVIVLECTKKKNSMKLTRNNECCVELVENNLNNSNAGLENPGYVTLRSETMRSCRSTAAKADNKNVKNPAAAAKDDKNSKDSKRQLRKTRSNQMVSTLCSQGKQKADTKSDSRYPRDSDGSWYTEWYDSRTYENQTDIHNYRAPSIMKHFSSCQEC